MPSRLCAGATVDSLRLRAWLIKFVASDVEYPVPAGPVIFESNLRCEFHQLFLRKLLAQAFVKIVRNVCRSSSHGICQINDQMFLRIESCQIVAFDGQQLLITQSGFSAYSRIDVDSKRATDERRGSHFRQLDITQRHAAFATDSGFHCYTAPNQAGLAHLNFRRRQVLAKHLSHHAIEPTKMPRSLTFFET